MAATKLTPKKAAERRDLWVSLLEGEHPALLSVVQAMPDAKLSYKPEPRLMDFRALAVHIAGTGSFFAELIERGATPAPAEEQEMVKKAGVPATTAALAKQVGKMLASAAARFKKAAPARLATPVDFYGMGAHPAVDFISWHLFHLVHHRGQLSTYLRVAGAKVPPVYGPTADATFEDMTKKK